MSIRQRIKSTDWHHCTETVSTDKEDSTNKNESVDLSDMPSLEGHEKVNEGKGLKISKQTINETSNIISTNKSRI